MKPAEVGPRDTKQMMNSFAAEKPPPLRVIIEVALIAAEESAGYFNEG